MVKIEQGTRRRGRRRRKGRGKQTITHIELTFEAVFRLARLADHTDCYSIHGLTSPLMVNTYDSADRMAYVIVMEGILVNQALVSYMAYFDVVVAAACTL